MLNLAFALKVLIASFNQRYCRKVDEALKNILNAPNNYHNRLLEAVAERHLISVKMLTYLYEGDFTNEDRWNLLENYFLGIIPEKVKHDCKQERPDIIFD